MLLYGLGAAGQKGKAKEEYKNFSQSRFSVFSFLHDLSIAYKPGYSRYCLHEVFYDIDMFLLIAIKFLKP